MDDGLWDEFLNLDLEGWILQNCDKEFGREEYSVYPWFTIFAYVSWNIWLNRCSETYEGKSKNVCDIGDKCRVSLHEYEQCHNSSETKGPRREVMVAWSFPDQGWYTFNTDGSVWNNGNAAGGGVLRDEAGGWITGFAHNLGNCTIMEAELHAIWDAVSIARRLQINCLRVETDSNMAVQMICNGVNLEHSCASLINHIRGVVFGRSWTCRIRHVYREANSVADWLANHAHSLTKGLHEIKNCPSDCSSRFLADLSGVSFPRLVFA